MKDDVRALERWLVNGGERRSLTIEFDPAGFSVFSNDDRLVRIVTTPAFRSETGTRGVLCRNMHEAIQALALALPHDPVQPKPDERGLDTPQQQKHN